MTDFFKLFDYLFIRIPIRNITISNQLCIFKIRHIQFVLVGADPAYKLREGGRLCDIVPTLIELMGLEKPKEMTGESLLVK